jgi:hypothetical protein
MSTIIRDHDHEHHHDHDRQHNMTILIAPPLTETIRRRCICCVQSPHGYTELAADTAIRDNSWDSTVKLAPLALSVTTMLQIDRRRQRSVARLAM